MSRTSDGATGNTRAFPAPIINLVVFREPGPPRHEIESASVAVVERNSMCRSGGMIGHLVLARLEFDRVWQLVDTGRALESAAMVLPQLGSDTGKYVGRIDDFIYGWAGQKRSEHGRVLLLQVIPRG